MYRQYYFVNSIVARKQDEATTKYRIRKSMSNVDATGSTMEMEIKFAEQKHAKLK